MPLKNTDVRGFFPSCIETKMMTLQECDWNQDAQLRLVTNVR